MTPRKIDRNLSPPEWLYFDDPEKLHHYTGRSDSALRSWAARGLITIHSQVIGSREFEYVVYAEVRAAVQATTKGHTWKKAA